MLASVAEPEQHYLETVMPEKIRLNLAYAQLATVWTDVAVVLATLARSPGLLRRAGLLPRDRVSEGR
jgi:lipopolysaccharide/colanic/teichoic acid biosynthesis glycosyltransferase